MGSKDCKIVNLVTLTVFDCFLAIKSVFSEHLLLGLDFTYCLLMYRSESCEVI